MSETKDQAAPGEGEGEDARSVLVHEGFFARVYCATSGADWNTLESPTGAVAIKVPAGEPPSTEQLKRLRDEYVNCKRAELLGCTATRRALRRVSALREDGAPTRAIYLEWAEGITLMEWTSSNVIANVDISSRRCDDAARHRALCRVVRLAWEVAGALAELHEAGITHNRLNIEKIIVDEHLVVSNKEDVHDGQGNRALGEVNKFSIKIIGLGAATFWNDRLSSAFVRAKQQDLASLGVVYESMILGHSGPLAFGASGERDEVSARGFTPTSLVNLSESGTSLVGIPVAVRTLISALATRGECQTSDCSYCSARDLQLDLSQMLDYPERFLFETERHKVTPGVLNFPLDRIYGRQREIAAVFDAYSRIANAAGAGRTEIVMVSGMSGSGKSSLVRHCRQLLDREKDADNFVCGKFDSLHHVEPLSTIRAAFTDYFYRLSEISGKSDLDSMSSAIRERVGPDGIVTLLDLFPSLSQIIEGPSIDRDVARLCGTGGQNRLKYLLCSVIEVLARQSHPLVLFLDDLQWADPISLGIIEALVTYTSNAYLLFIGCYRDNEVGSAHALPFHLHEVEKQGVPITNIVMGGISRDSMNHMISDAMHALRTSTKSLTDEVFFHTGGNALYGIQFITSLRDEGLLTASSLGSWQWNVETIRLRNIPDTSLEIITEKILNLPVDVIGALEVAACLGSRCQEATLHLISVFDTDSGHNDLVSMLNIAVCEGLMNKVHSKYEFVHDLVQHAVYRLIPESVKGPLHLQIGKRIWELSKFEGLQEENTFLAVDQIFLASTFVDLGQDVDMAKLFLRAGRKAMSLVLFPSAATYFKAGIDVLGAGYWDDHYSLGLELCESFAEAEYCNGHFEEMGEVIEDVLARARCFDDKLATYSTLIKALGAMGRTGKAVEIGLLVLEELGELFPESEERAIMVCHELSATRNMLDGFSDDTLIRTMKEMEDERQVNVMQFLRHVALYTSIDNKVDLNRLIVLRMTQVTLRYGACEESAFAFACYGGLLCQKGQSTRGYKFGQFALEMLNRFKRQSCLPAVYASLYIKLLYWGEPLKLSLQPLFRGYKTGMVFGELQFAMISARFYCLFSFCCGKQLAVLDREIGMFCEVMMRHNEERLLATMLILRQTIQNLMGYSRDPLNLSGSAINQDELLSDAAPGASRNVVWFVHYHRMWLACIFGDYRRADECATAIRFSEMSPGFCVCNSVCLDGLTSLALARRTKCSRGRRTANYALKKMKTWAAITPSNFQHMVFLLEAEFASLADDKCNGAKMYDAAITLAGQNGFTPEQALACERAATFYKNLGDKAKASHYCDMACDLYFKWGAQGKVDQLRKDALSLRALGT